MWHAFHLQRQGGPGQRMGIPRATWPSSLFESLSFKFSERSYLQRLLTLTSGQYTHVYTCACTLTCSHVQMHVYTHTHRASPYSQIDKYVLFKYINKTKQQQQQQQQQQQNNNNNNNNKPGKLKKKRIIHTLATLHSSHPAQLAPTVSHQWTLLAGVFPL
jgi:hypothetical protein